MRKIFLFPIFVILTNLTFAQQVFFEPFSEMNGLSSDVVFDLAEDKDGNIWMATILGVNRYNGVDLKRFTVDDKFPVDSRIMDVMVDRNNVLWVGNMDTCLFLVNKINTKHQEFYLFEEIRDVVTILEDAEGLVYVATYYEIVILKNYSVIKRIPFKERIENIDVDSDKIYVANYKNGFIIYDKKSNTKKLYTTTEGLISNECNVVKKINNDIYIGHNNGYSVIKNNDSIETQTPYGGAEVYNFYLDKEERLWVLAFDGIQIFKKDKKLFDLNTTNNTFIGMSFQKLIFDREGNIWVCMNGGGVMKIPGLDLIRFSGALMENEAIYGTAQENDSTYWLSYFSQTFFVKMTLKESVASYDTISIPDANPTFSTYDPIEKKIVISGIGGIATIKNGHITIDGKISNYTNDVLWRSNFVLKDSAVYIGSFDGLNRYKNGVNKKIWFYNGSPERPVVYVSAVTGDTKDVFVGSNGGIQTVRNDSLVTIDLFQPLFQYDHQVQSLVKDKYNNYWADINGNRILRFWRDETGLKYKCYDLFKLWGIRGPFCFFTYKDILWLRTFSKLFQLDLNSLYEEKPIIQNVLDINDRIKPENPHFTTYYVDSSEYLWIMGNYGLIRHNFKTRKKNAVETINNIRNIKIRGSEDIVDKFSKGNDSKGLPVELTLPHHQNEITFDYVGICHTSQKEVLYKTRLVGMNSIWSQPSSDNHITYNNLSPGTYTFEMISCNNDGLWNKEPLRFSFTVLPAWYQTWWFKLIIAIVIAVIIYVIFLWRINIIKREKNKQIKLTHDILASQEQERKRIAQELHDGVGQELSMLKVNVERSKDPVILNKVVKIIEDIRFLSRNIHPHYFEKLGLTKAIEMIVDENNKLEKIFWVHELENVDDQFSSAQQLMLFRVIQECMNNTIKHSGAKNAKVTIEKNEKNIHIIIQDNGVGFQTDQTKMNSLGLSTIRERVRSLDGTVTIKSKPGSGTQTDILIPVKTS